MARPVTGWPAFRSTLAAAGAAALSCAFAYGASGQENDVIMTYLPAWRLAHGLGLALPPGQATPGEAVQAAGGVFSDRMPGLIALAVPSQLGAAGPSWWAVRFVTAALIAVVVWCACRLWGGSGCALLVVTPLLSVAGRTLWPETAVSALLLAALLASRHSRALPCLLPLAALCVLVRPPAILLLAVVAFGAGPDRRRRVLWLAGGALVGSCALVAYDEWLFAQLLPAGSYAPHSQGFGHVLSALWIGLVSPARGLLLYAPWLAWALRRRAWSPVVAVGAVYVLASWCDSGSWGGTGFVGTRYPIPLLLLAFPALWNQFGSSHWFRIACLWSTLWTVAGLLTPVVRDPARNPWIIPAQPAALVAALVASAVVGALCAGFAARRTTGAAVAGHGHPGARFVTSPAAVWTAPDVRQT